ncbi:MAG: hypothetical protein WBD99_03680 [Thermodesulfobacteriota bacterium]
MISRLLDQIIGHWKKEFTGISALDLSHSLGLTHPVVIEKLKELANEGKISLREAALFPIPLTPSSGDHSEKSTNENQEGVDTLIAFPSRDILEKAFAKESVDYGTFTNRLHKGDIQIKHYYFQPEVLDKYFNYPDRYYIKDDIVEGLIMTKDDYYFSLPENERDVDTFAIIRYGKRRLKDDKVAIAVIDHDLSELPKKEQLHWASHEIEKPEFLEEDKEYELYWKQNFDAEIIEYEDPLQQIYETIRKVNDKTGEKLFRNESENPWLKYPVINTEKEYQNAHSELFKLIGRDSLNKDVLLTILKNKLKVSDEDLLRDDTKEEKGQWALFKTLISKVSNA